jgi:response regulator RpfG family c-di-GMP phosphodiesterase
LALEITLNHHQHWDGTGYPAPAKKGPGIPLSARIVALADVYDALISRRAYKDPWEEESVLHHIRSQRGGHFDPELVDIFFEIYDIIRAIRTKWES